jgi:Ni/Fe-hydrogenase subunit HybB-like protein
MNVSITGFEGSAGVRYFPKWTELAVTGSIIAAGFALFGMAVKYLPIFPQEEHVHEPVTENESALPDVSAVMEHAGD